MNQKKLKLILAITSAISLVAAIVLFVLSLTVIQNTATRVIMMITSVLFLALAVEVFYLFGVIGDTHANYFLYDSRQGRNISVQKLAFQTINVRMNRFLSGYAASEGKLWTDKIFDNPYLEMDDAFKPLVAYKLLFDLAEHDSEGGWRCFELASYETADFVCAALEMGGDTEMAQNLRQMKSATPINLKYVRDYLVRNRQYLKEKMRRYVCENIQQF